MSKVGRKEMRPEDRKQPATYKIDPKIKAAFEAAVPIGKRGKVVESLIAKYLAEWHSGSNLPASSKPIESTSAKE